MTTPTPLTHEQTITEERTDYQVQEGDNERFAHYADRDKIMQAMVYGTPIRALCGKVWVPSRDPSRFPVCPECKELYENDDLFYDEPKAASGE